MSSREEILSRLRKGQWPGEAPVPWVSQNHYQDLAQQFEQALTAVGGEVHRAGSLDGALEELDAVLEAIGARQVLADWCSPITEINAGARWPDISWYLVGQSDGDVRAFAASADAGLSVAQAALAETGSVLVGSGSGRSRLTSLLPPVHIVLTPASCLTADIFTWTAERPGDLPASLTWISGPSKTADIEQTMAVGVHGPGRFIVILYDEIPNSLDARG